MDGYRFGPARIDVASDDPDAARWLREFLLPWFEACPPGAGDFRVRLRISGPDFEKLERQQAAAAPEPHACFALDSQTVELPGWTGPGGSVLSETGRDCFYRLRPGSVEIVARTAGPRVRVALMRSVREIAALLRLEAGGCLDLHAAAFAVKDRAVLLVGAKRAGKTTLLANALGSGRADLLANDRVFVETGRAPARALGMPTLVSIRPDTLERFPALRSSLPGGTSLLHAAEIEARAGVADPAAAPLKYSLSPAQLAQHLGAGTVPGATVAAIVFPEISPAEPRWSLARIAPEDAGARLRECLYGGRLGPRPRTVFEDLVGSRPERRDPAPSLESLATRVPAFACRLGPDAYRDGADAWLRALSL